MRDKDDLHGFLLERTFSGAVGFLIGSVCGLAIELICLAAGWVESIDKSVVLLFAAAGALVGVLVGAVILNALLGLISLAAGFFAGIVGMQFDPIGNRENDGSKWIIVLFAIGALLAALLYLL